MAVFRNLLAHPIQLEGDWRVAKWRKLFSPASKMLQQIISFIPQIYHFRRFSEPVSGAVQITRDNLSGKCKISRR